MTTLPPRTIRTLNDPQTSVARPAITGGGRSIVNCSISSPSSSSGTDYVRVDISPHTIDYTGTATIWWNVVANINISTSPGGVIRVQGNGSNDFLFTYPRSQVQFGAGPQLLSIPFQIVHSYATPLTPAYLGLEVNASFVDSTPFSFTTQSYNVALVVDSTGANCSQNDA